MRKYLVLGMAGHIDHGKTSLIKALTGVDLDTLKEEQLRGITIELGFTSFALPSNQILGIVDVPGHEKFIKTMVAGVGGIDMVLLVIAADEGVMPQTREHLDIVNLLEIKRGVIALTKMDLVDEEWSELVKEDIKALTKGSFLENAPIVPVSALKGEGLDSLIYALDGVARKIEDRDETGLFRLPVDRVFVMRGFGTVVTGTLISGQIEVGEDVVILPKGRKAKIRGIHVYKSAVNKAIAGQRTAINLGGVERIEVKRGDLIARPASLNPTRRIDVALKYLSHPVRPLKNRKIVRFHHGTNMTYSKIIFLDRDELLPGEETYAQMELSEEIVALPLDRFIIRGDSFIETIGGGKILDPYPPRHKRKDAKIMEGLKILDKGEVRQKILYFLSGAGFKGLDITSLNQRGSLSPSFLKEILNNMLKKGEIISFNDGERFIHGKLGPEFRERVLSFLSAYHKENPLKVGIPKEELRSRFSPEIEGRLFYQMLDLLHQKGEIIYEKDKVKLSAYTLFLSEEDSSLKERLFTIYHDKELSPPTVKEVTEILREKEEKVKNLLGLLWGEGKLTRVKDDLYFFSGSLSRLREALILYLKEKGEIHPKEFKEMTQSSRKYAIPLLEYFDSERLTIRTGEKRILRGKT